MWPSSDIDSQRKVYLVLLVLFLSSLERTVLFASRNQGTLVSRRVNSWNLYVKFRGYFATHSGGLQERIIIISALL